LRHTPLFLTLLCRFVQQEKRLPSGDHDLLWLHINRLAERDQEYTQRKHNLTSTQLLEGAMELAVLFASNPKLSLSPTHDQIATELPPGRYSAEQLEHLLAALIDVKIGRSDVPEARAGDRRFTFAHRRYQETLFVRYLAGHPQFLSPYDLLLDPRWREYTVALFQSESSEVLAPFLEEASRLVARSTETQVFISSRPGFGEGLGYYDWTDGEIHLLALLQEGLARRIEEVPATLSSEIERLLSTRWVGGDFHDRTMVLRLGGLLPQQRLAEYLEFAVKKGTLEVQDEAFQKIVFLRKPPDSLVKWVRERLSRQVLYANKRADLLRIEALCARLPDVIGAEIILQRGLGLRRLLAPLATVARAGVWYAPPPAALAALNPDSSKEFIFEALLSSMLLLLNAAGIAFGLSAPPSEQNGVFLTVSSWLPEFVLFLISLKYILRTRGATTRPGRYRFLGPMLLTLLVLLIVSVPLAPFLCIFLGVLRQSWWLVGAGVVLLVLLVGFMTPGLISKLRARGRHLARLKAIRCQPQAPAPLAPQAQSLVELGTWLEAQRDTLIPDESHTRSLSRLVIHGLELDPKAQVLEPPLLVHCAAKKWSVEEVRAVFEHLQRAQVGPKPK
jgi:hypothetical protein